MISRTATRVVEHSKPEYSTRIHHDMERRLDNYRSAGEGAVMRRLEELEWEWDIERVLEANASSLSLLGMALGRLVDRRFYLLPAAVAGFLLQHALQGWCPPIGFLRRRGVRTSREIELERHALLEILEQKR